MYHTAPRQRARFDLLAARRGVAFLSLLSANRRVQIEQGTVFLLDSHSEP
jgi:hypothetical protein